MATYTVKIDSDYTGLGEGATQEMLDGYAENLATKLSADFGVSIEVEQELGARGQCVGPDDDIAAQIFQAVRDIQGGDGWVDLLPPGHNRIILDNGGGIILQLGTWAHSYDGARDAMIVKNAADDIREWLKTGTTGRWEGHDADALAVAPTADEIRTGGYRVIVIDRDSDTAASLADEVRWGAAGEALGNALATTEGCAHADHGKSGRCPGCGTYLTDLSSAELSTARTINDEIVDAIPPGEEEVTVHLDSPNGPKAYYLGSLEIEAVLARLPAGWTVHESDWSNAVQIDDLTWSVPLSKVDPTT